MPPKNQFVSLFDQVPIGLFRTTPAGRFHEANAMLVEMLSYPSKIALMSMNVGELYVEQDARDNLLRLLNEDGLVEGYEARLKDFFGAEILVRISAQAVKNSHGAITYYEGMMQVVTAPDTAEDDDATDTVELPALQQDTIVSSVGEGIVLLDQEFRYLMWNKYMEKMTGMMQVDLLGKVAFEIFPHLIRQGVDKMMRRALAGETVESGDIQFDVPQTAHRGWYNAVYAPYLSSDGRVTAVVITIRDMTERKEAETTKEQLLISEREQRLFSESLGRVSMALSSIVDLSELLEIICKESAELFQVESTHVWLVRPAENGAGPTLEGFAGYGKERDKFVNMRVPLSDPDNLAARVIRERKPIFINELPDHVHTGLSGIFRVSSIMGIPLLKGEQAVGALLIVENNKINRFDGQDLDVAMQLGSHAAIAVENARLIDDLQQANTNLERTYNITLQGWAKALELRDAETQGHSMRVTELTVRLAQTMGFSGDALEHIRRGALLHDIGKMGIPDRILGKPGPLDTEEWKIMRQHPRYAYDLLKNIKYLGPALDIPYAHHEKWDGSGYPQGLAREAIPLSARLFSVADVWDALTSDRPYRAAWPREKALQYIQSQAGKDFDPQVVDAFLKIV